MLPDEAKAPQRQSAAGPSEAICDQMLLSTQLLVASQAVGGM